jgi:hypothetical protein
VQSGHLARYVFHPFFLTGHRNHVVVSRVLEYLSDRVREAEASDQVKSAEVSDRVKSTEDRMKRIADWVYKADRRSDEAESRSGYPGRLGIGYGWLRYGVNRNKIAY